MKKSALRDAAAEYLQVKHEIHCSELREMDLEDAVKILNREINRLSFRIQQLEGRRDELAAIIAEAVLELLRKK